MLTSPLTCLSGTNPWLVQAYKISTFPTRGSVIFNASILFSIIHLLLSSPLLYYFACTLQFILHSTLPFCSHPTFYSPLPLPSQVVFPQCLYSNKFETKPTNTHNPQPINSRGDTQIINAHNHLYRPSIWGWPSPLKGPAAAATTIAPWTAELLAATTTTWAWASAAKASSTNYGTWTGQ